MKAPRRAASKAKSFLSSSGRAAPMEELTRPDPSLVSSSGPVRAGLGLALALGLGLELGLVLGLGLGLGFG